MLGLGLVLRLAEALDGLEVLLPLLPFSRAGRLRRVERCGRGIANCGTAEASQRVEANVAASEARGGAVGCHHPRPGAVQAIFLGRIRIIKTGESEGFCSS